MGAEGLKQAKPVRDPECQLYCDSPEVPAFPVLYTGRDERVAQKCILDIRR